MPTGHLLDINLDDLVMEMGMPPHWPREKLQKGLQYAITPS